MVEANVMLSGSSKAENSFKGMGRYDRGTPSASATDEIRIVPQNNVQHECSSAAPKSNTIGTAILPGKSDGQKFD